MSPSWLAPLDVAPVEPGPWLGTPAPDIPARGPSTMELRSGVWPLREPSSPLNVPGATKGFEARELWRLLKPELAAPVTPLTAPLTAPVTPLTAPLTAPVAPLTAPLTAPVAPLTAPPTAPVTPLTAPLTAPVTPLTAPPTAPVTPLTAPPTAPVTPLTAPPTAPVTPLTAPPMAPVTPLTAPLTAPVTPLTAPVTAPVTPLTAPVTLLVRELTMVGRFGMLASVDMLKPAGKPGMFGNWGIAPRAPVGKPSPQLSQMFVPWMAMPRAVQSMKPPTPMKVIFGASSTMRMPALM